jgi:flavin-dependent dehydrogenase
MRLFFDMPRGLPPRRRGGLRSDLQLRDGSRIAVIGGGPAGSLFSYLLLRLARRLDLRLDLEIFEPRDFTRTGPAGCNHCGGTISEWLVQVLALEGINLPTGVVQRGLDAYELHTDVGSVRIAAPGQERRIATVFRGWGPRGSVRAEGQGFDGLLLGLARSEGARLRREPVTALDWHDGRPWLAGPRADGTAYDLVVVASGINSGLLERIERLDLGFHRPPTVVTYIAAVPMEDTEMERRLGSAMHVFHMELPRLHFAALIPKRGFATLVLLGEDVDSELVQTFLQAPLVRRLLPNGVTAGCPISCHCFPLMSIGAAERPFADRLLFIGDSGVTRLYKDGIGAAYRTAKAAATSVLLDGLAARDLRRHFWPICRRIATDNACGRRLFRFSALAQGGGIIQRAILHMAALEQGDPARQPDMSTMLWDMFSGSAPYCEILLRCLHPRFLWRLACCLAWAATTPGKAPEGRVSP